MGYSDMVHRNLKGTFYCVKAPLVWDMSHENGRNANVYTDTFIHVCKFVNDLRQVGGFLWVLRFPPPTKMTATI